MHGQNLFGKQGLVAVAIGKIIEKKTIEVWGDGSAIRDYIYIEDLSDAFYQLINKDICNVTINIGSGRGYSVNDVLAFLKIISKVDFKIEYKNARPVDVSNVVLNIDSMKKCRLKTYIQILLTLHVSSLEKVGSGVTCLEEKADYILLLLLNESITATVRLCLKV